MKKLIIAALLLPLTALAQTYPSPTFNSVTLQNPLAVSSGGTGSTTSTGSGSVVLSNSPTLVTPNLGTPSAITLTNGSGLPVSSGISGLGTGVAMALGNAVTGSGSPVLASSPTIASPTVTGAFNATGLVTTADLAVQAANTVLANATASSASPTALAVPSCNATTSALAWTSGSGFSCTTNLAVNYTGSGSSPVTRTSTQRFGDDIHLEDYCSAATLNTSGGDITTCLQNAINALPANGGRCVTLPALPSGVSYWAISSTINIGNGSAGSASTTNGACIRGSGAAGFFGSYGTYLTWTGAASGTTGSETVTIHQMQNGQLAKCTMPLSELSLIISSTAWAAGLPTAKPSTSGVVWNNGGIVSIS